MFRALSIAALMGLVPAGAWAHTSAPFISVGQTTEAPRGFIEMCLTAQALCGRSTDRGATSLVTAATVDYSLAEVPTVPQPGKDSGQTQLVAINRFVNARVVQRTDAQVYGKDEHWQRSGTERDAAGDCEDIAIEKRLQLIAGGFPADHLYFAVVYLSRVGLHVVLVARTGYGDMVLDSRTPYVTRWDRTPYSWVSIQSTDDPMHWQAPAPRRARQMQLASIGD